MQELNIGESSSPPLTPADGPGRGAGTRLAPWAARLLLESHAALEAYPQGVSLAVRIPEIVATAGELTQPVGARGSAWA